VSDTKYTIAEHGDRISEFMKRIIRLAGLDVRFKLSEEPPRHPGLENPDIHVKFTGEDAGMLVANKTELLLALEHLTMEAIGMPGEDHSRICFDANDHRMLRIEELRSSAVSAAERVLSTQRPFRFAPMNSRERRIIHLALRDFKELRSESEGLEPHRNVAIYPAGMPSTPKPPEPFRRSSGGGGRGPGGRPGGGRRDGDRGGGRGPRRERH
jgi:spoIIIJ-associated protein